MLNGIPAWVIVAGAAVIGYFVVSKVIDYFRAGSVWEKPPEPPPEYSGNWPENKRE